MNPNQLTLNLNTMKATRTRSNSRNATKKYNIMLNDLKEIITYNDVKPIGPIIRSYNVSNCWGGFLKENNIVFKDENENYKWNNNTPILNKIIQSFRNNQREINLKHYPNRFSPKFIDKIKNQNVNYLNNIKVVKDEPKLIKQRTKMNNIGNEDTKVIYSVQKQEIGLIRKFLKWIY